MEKPKAKEYYDIQECVEYIQLKLTSQCDYITFVGENMDEGGQNCLISLPDPSLGTKKQQAMTKAFIEEFGEDAEYKFWW